MPNPNDPFLPSQAAILQEMTAQDVVISIRQVSWAYRAICRKGEPEQLLRDLAPGDLPYVPNLLAEQITSQSPVIFGFHPETRRIVGVEHLPFWVLGLTRWQDAYREYLKRGRYLSNIEIINGLFATLRQYAQAQKEKIQ